MCQKKKQCEEREGLSCNLLLTYVRAGEGHEARKERKTKDRVDNTRGCPCVWLFGNEKLQICEKAGGLLFVCFGFVVGRFVTFVVVVAQWILLLIVGRPNRITLLLFMPFSFNNTLHPPMVKADNRNGCNTMFIHSNHPPHSFMQNNIIIPFSRDDNNNAGQ